MSVNNSDHVSHGERNPAVSCSNVVSKPPSLRRTYARHFYVMTDSVTTVVKYGFTWSLMPVKNDFIL